jgi:hypothetical protein
MAAILCLLVLLSALAAASEAPTIDPIPPFSVAEEESDAARRTIVVGGIGPSGQPLTVRAGSADVRLAAVAGVAFDAVAGSARVELSLPVNAFGSTLVFVAVSAADGTTTTRWCEVTVTGTPDPPSAVGGQIVVAPGMTATLSAASLQVEDPDRPDDASLTLRLTGTSLLGDLLRDGGEVLGVGATFTRADLAAGRLAFRHGGLLDPPEDSIRFTVSDGEFPPSAEGFSRVRSFLPVPPPVIGLPPAAPVWSEGGPAVQVCPDALFTDVSPRSYSRLTITVTVGSGWGEAGDVLDLRHDGVGAGQVGIGAGGLILFEGRPVGDFTGGRDGAPLEISFGSLSCDAAIAQAVLRTLRFHHLGGPPLRDRRPLVVGAEEYHGGLALPASRELVLRLIDQPPVVLTAGVGTLAGVRRSLALLAADADSPVLTWAVAVQPAIADLVVEDAAAGRVTLIPHPGLSGRDQAVVTVSDGVNPAVSATLAVVVTGGDDARPQALADPPFAALAGEPLAWEVAWDAPLAACTLVGAVPAGASAVLVDERRVRLAWTPAADSPAGLASFALLADAADGRATGRLPLLIAVRSRPQGVQ